MKFRYRFKVPFYHQCISFLLCSLSFLRFMSVLFVSQCIAKIMNLPELKLNPFLANLMHAYNAKPFFTGKNPATLKDPSLSSHFFFKARLCLVLCMWCCLLLVLNLSHQGKNYLEVDVNVYEFHYLARKVAYNALPTIKEFVIDMGLTVEGQCDEELPEQIIACARFSHIAVENALSFEKLLEQQQPRLAATSAGPAAPTVSASALVDDGKEKRQDEARVKGAAPVAATTLSAAPLPSPFTGPPPSPQPQIVMSPSSMSA